MILYHGTDCISAKAIVNNGIDLTLSRKGTDFGRGFYTTPVKQFAIERAIQKAKSKGEKPALVYLEVEDDWLQLYKLNGLSIKIFKGTSKEWFQFTINNRTGAEYVKQLGLRDHNLYNRYDIVTGPTVDSDIVALASELKKNPKIPDEIIINEAMTNKLSNQVSFHTAEAIQLIQNKLSYMKCNGKED